MKQWLVLVLIMCPACHNTIEPKIPSHKREDPKAIKAPPPGYGHKVV